MNEFQRKRVADKVGWWDKLKVAVTPGDVNERGQKLLQIADRNEEEERRKAQAEAIRRKRMENAE